MIAITRMLTAAALLACLAACGNKGPLVHPSPPQAEAGPAPATPPARDPTDTLPPADSAPPPSADPAGAPPASPPGGGGNG